MEIGVKNFERLCRSFDHPAALLDDNFLCLYSNSKSYFPKGSSLITYMQNPIEIKDVGVQKTQVIINGVCYCARIFHLIKDINVCEFLTIAEIISLSENTDFYQRIFPWINSIEHSIACLWKSSTALKNNFKEADEAYIEKNIENLQRILVDLDSVVKNSSEYLNMKFSPVGRDVLDIFGLTEGIINRCNTFLAACGRCVKFLTANEGFFILANDRHAINAMVNAIQNSLLYSPHDSVPIASLTRAVKDGKSYIVFQIVNDNIYFANENFGEELSINFGFQHLGFGIPIIKRFAENCGGEFYMEDMNGKMAVGVRIPEYIAPSGEPVKFESGGYVFYNTGIPDIVELKMLEVVNFFNINLNPQFT